MNGSGHGWALLFYGAMALAVAYFAHKVVWFVQFRRIQERLVQRGLERLRERTETTLIRWDRGADTSWSEMIGGEVDSPIGYVHRTEAKLNELVAQLESSRRPVGELFARVLAGEDSPSPDFAVAVLEVPRVHGEPITIPLRPAVPQVKLPRPLEPTLFELHVRSRYGLSRRLLAFLLGPADVVYSSSHVARMSQNVEVPTSILVRRVSLIALVVLAVVADITFAIRPRLIAWAEAWLHHRWDVHGMGPVAELWNENLPTLLGLSLWLAGYGAIYTTIFLYLFLRSRRHLRELDVLKHTADVRIASIVAHHRGQLVAWGRDYAASLDESCAIVVLQARMLIHRAIDRLRRRIASPLLIELSEQLARALFAKLPEASTELADVATEHTHSFRHALWPREEEMRYQVQLAQYRAAWRHLEMSVNAMRGHRPDPVAAHELWRTLVAYGRMFEDVVPKGFVTELEQARDASFQSLVAETDSELRELDERLGDLAEGLAHGFSAAPALVASRVQVTEESIAADVSRFGTEVLRVREKARLEAMAFEI